MRFAALCLLSVLLPSVAWAGDVSGSVTIQTPMAPRAVGRRHNPRYRSENPPQREEDEVTNTVVYLEKVDPAAFKVPPAHAVMQQKGKTFIPSVLPVVVGQVVDFPNDDPIYHNVYSESHGFEFELTEYAHGQSKSQVFKQPGVVELFCAIHATMNASILVLQNPFFSQPDKEHVYTIRNIPKGHYNLVFWHPRVPAQTHPIDVPEKGAVKLDATL